MPIAKRTCIVCRQKSPQPELLRIVKTRQGKVQLDPEQALKGRGCYVCKSKDCIETFLQPKKVGALRHHLKLKEISDELKTTLEKQLSELKFF